MIENTVLAEGVPGGRAEFSLRGDGKRAYFPVGPAYYEFDEQGDFIGRMPIKSTQARSLVPLSDGRFLSAQSHSFGQVALLSADGTELSTLVKRGPMPDNLRADGTGWTSPTGFAFDALHQLMFVADTTMAAKGTPDPDWSRIAIFNGAGKYLRQIAGYDGATSMTNDEHRTWYDDIEVDAKRSRLYVTARATHELWAFDYAGALRGRVPGVGGVAVFPNGDVAVCDPGGHQVRVYDSTLKLSRSLNAASVLDLETDASGRLYASVADPTILYLRWPANGSDPTPIRTRFARIAARFPTAAVAAEGGLSLPVAVTGRPLPSGGTWRAFARPSDGSDLSWRELPATDDSSAERLSVDTSLLIGLNDVAVRYGTGAIDRAAGARDLHVQQRLRFYRANDSELFVRSATGRTAFQRGETIALRIETRANAASAFATLTLEQGSSSALRAVAGAPLEHGAVASARIPAENGYWQLTPAFTRRLLPGHYVLRASSAAPDEGARRGVFSATVGSGDRDAFGVDARRGAPKSAVGATPKSAVGATAESAARGAVESATRRAGGGEFEFEIAEAEPRSPMQRILYHEFGQTLAGESEQKLPDLAEQLAFVRDYVASVAELGFTRETDRTGAHLLSGQSAGAWRAQSVEDAAAHDGLPEGGTWQPELYLDRAVGAGIAFDTQILTHCASVRIADSWFPTLNAGLQRISQWFGRYPSFYGFNYNDELFFPTSPFAQNPVPADRAWLDATAARLSGHPMADTYRAALTRMYAEFNRSVTQVRPDLARTATPMWQFPAVEGSYAPTIYAHMTEAYSHYLSEGFAWPFYAAHAAEMLRRPNLPLRAVFDNGYATGDGESYLKDALQVLGRGVQGFGVEHELPLRDAAGSNALRVMNTLAEAYGPIFAEASPVNEASVLYSYAQDVTETRDALGTPHWERVLAVYGAGLMAGLPMSISYEEDVAAGSLLDHGRPKQKYLFLVGQTAALPGAVKTALNAFHAAGGVLVADADSASLAGLPDVVRFAADLLGPARAARDAYDGDALFPAVQPAYEAIAAALAKQFGRARGFPVDTSDPWVSKNHFDGGAIQYVLLASETSPYPWDAGGVWNVNGRYSKSYYPKRVRVSMPHAAELYDVFDRRLVSAGERDGDASRERVGERPGEASRGVVRNRTAEGSRGSATEGARERDGEGAREGGSGVIEADLTVFPGRLYALAPAKMSAPKLSARLSASNLSIAVDVGLGARVPLQIEISDGQGGRSTLFRGSTLQGKFEQTLARPAGPGPFHLQVNELISGLGSALDLAGSEAGADWLLREPAVDVEREPQIRSLLQKGPRALRLLGESALSDELRASLVRALEQRGRTVIAGDAAHSADAPDAPDAEQSSDCLAIAVLGEKRIPEPIRLANQAGLFGRPLSDRYPGPGRGLLSALFSPRIYGENCVALVGGDARGLELATRRFLALPNVEQLATDPNKIKERPSAGDRELTGAPSGLTRTPTRSELTGAPSGLTRMPTLSERVGVRLSGIRASYGKVLVSARGYLANLARVDDEGDHGRLVRVERVGQSPETSSLFLSKGGTAYGLAARTTGPLGEVFSLSSTRASAPDWFASFGDPTPFQYPFSVSSDASTVLAPGPYGVVAWRRDHSGFHEAWAVDYWKEFDALDWPVSAEGTRMPSFATTIPEDGDLALIASADLESVGGITNLRVSHADVSARSLTSGALAWRFHVPITGAAVVPVLHTNRAGTLLVVQAQVGNAARYYALEKGRAIGNWSADQAPLSISITEHTRRIATAHGSGSRLLDVRAADGSVLFSKIWHAQPLAVVFAEDETSVIVSDDAGLLSRVNAAGEIVWQRALGSSAELVQDGARLYTAGWDGRVRAFSADGSEIWALDLSPAMSKSILGAPGAAARQSGSVPDPSSAVHVPERPATASLSVPSGTNLLRSGQATLSVGGTVGWKSTGKVQVLASALTNGAKDDGAVPWIPAPDLYWDGMTYRKVWAEIDFKQPTHVHALTVYEDPKSPEFWPNESLIQVWDAASQRFRTAKHGLFLHGPRATYVLDLEGVQRLRYLPWGNYFRNFKTSEIEVR